MEQNGTTCTKSAKPRLIGFSGKIGTGKTTVCEMLTELLTAHGLTVKTISFGMILKRKVAETFNFPLEWCYSVEGKARSIKFSQPHYVLEEKILYMLNDATYKKQTTIIPYSRAMSVRNLLQWWGTEVCRYHDEDYWVKEWTTVVDKAQAFDVVLVDDVRFPNELQAVSMNPYFPGQVYRLTPYPGWNFYSSHESETALDSYDFGRNELKPSKGRKALYEVAEFIFKQIMETRSCIL